MKQKAPYERAVKKCISLPGMLYGPLSKATVRKHHKEQQLFKRATAKTALEAYLSGQISFARASRLSGVTQDVFLQMVKAVAPNGS